MTNRQSKLLYEAWRDKQKHQVFSSRNIPSRRSVKMAGNGSGQKHLKITRIEESVPLERVFVRFP